MAMMADYDVSQLDTAYSNIDDMSLVQVDGGTANLTAYMTGLNPDGTVKSGCTYSISLDGGIVTQSTP